MSRLSPASTRFILKLASLAAVLGLSAPMVGSCGGSSANPLIGSWKFSSTTNKSGAVGCSSVFTFTDKVAMIVNPPSSAIPAGSVRNMAVTYVASPKLVAVMTNAADHVNYSFVDKDHMYTEDAWGRCNYERTS